MQNFGSPSTPLKEVTSNSHQFDTADSRGLRSNELDYKAKTFKLMKQLAETEVLNKKHNNHIAHLERNIQSYKQDINRLLSALGTNTYEQAMKKVLFLTDSEHTSNRAKIEEWSNLVEEYKKIINAQQYKFIKQQQQLKISEARIRRLEEDKDKKIEDGDNLLNQKRMKEQEQKQKAELLGKQEELKSVRKELNLLKDEYKDILMDRERWKEKYESLQSKYNLEIQHFQKMEKHVEERLMEVEREMIFYQDERAAHMEKIELLKQQIQYQDKHYFSFGGVKHTETQTDLEQPNSPYNYECLQISIKTLLEENSKLKNTLLILYQRQPGQELPKDIELELKILLNMHDNNLRGTQNHNDSQNEELERERQKERQRQREREIERERRKNELDWIQGKIEEAGEEEENDDQEDKKPEQKITVSTDPSLTVSENCDSSGGE